MASPDQDPKVGELTTSHRWSLRLARDPEVIALTQPKYLKGINKSDKVSDEKGLFASFPILAAVAAVESLQTPTYRLNPKVEPLSFRTR